MSSDPNCEVCAGAGYVFGSDDNSLNGAVIQRCDTCAIFDGDEAAAEWVSSQIKSLPAELTRQREEIARLRGALEQLLSAAEHLSGASVASYGSGYAIPQETRDAARAALQQTGVGA